MSGAIPHNAVFVYFKSSYYDGVVIAPKLLTSQSVLHRVFILRFSLLDHLVTFYWSLQTFGSGLPYLCCLRLCGRCVARRKASQGCEI